MERTYTCIWLFCWFCWLLLSPAYSEGNLRKVRGVSLGGWLVVEGWIKQSLFDNIPNAKMLDGTEAQFKSMALNKFITAENGGGNNVTVNKTIPTTFETFRLWRVNETEFQFRSSGGQFLSCVGEACSFSANTDSPSESKTFSIETKFKKVHIKYSNGIYLQATSPNQLTADYTGTPGWDNNTATFEMILVSFDYHGEYQLTNGWGAKAKDILKEHRDNFITEDDFKFMSEHGLNTVRIPVGWWIYMDPNPPAPYVGGSLAALDNAFKWAQNYNMKCIINLHAAPGSQTGKETSSSRDGSADWSTSPKYISQTLDVIDFLASRYAKNPALLGISLLNNPNASLIPLDVLVSYYSKGYQIVRKYSSTAYVIIAQRVGKADPMELIEANIGSSNLVLEMHSYNFDNMTSDFSVEDNIEFVKNSRRAQIKALSSRNGPLIFVGEWVNKMARDDVLKSEYERYGKAQVEVYDEASFGWAYWTFRNDVVHWSLEWNIQNGYLQLGDSPVKQWPMYHILLFAAFWGLYLSDQIL
ncbi:hypothetical protein ACHQM5_004090 [Ranunculus cassubicifolius]